MKQALVIINHSHGEARTMITHDHHDELYANGKEVCVKIEKVIKLLQWHELDCTASIVKVSELPDELQQLLRNDNVVTEEAKEMK